MIASLLLMFIILLMQFNSLYCTLLTLSTVVLSTIGVLLGMVVTGQTFSVIMTGTGVVALAGCGQQFHRADRHLSTPAGHRHGQDRCGAENRRATLRPILLTTITTMIGLFPMAVQVTVDVVNRTVQLAEPTSAWWCSCRPPSFSASASRPC